MRTWIDVRGVWPVLFVGLQSFVLVGQSRSITVAEALDLVNY